MKDLIRPVLILVIVFLVVWLGKSYYDRDIASQKTEPLIIKTESKVEGYKFEIKNMESLDILLPEIKSYKITLPNENVKKNVDSVMIELVDEQQEWYRVALENSDDYLSSVGVSFEDKKLLLKIYLSKDQILNASKEDRDWILNNIVLTALYALANDWETGDLLEQNEVVKRLDDNSSIELPFEILQ